MGEGLAAVTTAVAVTAGAGGVGALALARLGRRRPSLAAVGAPIVVVLALAVGVAAASRAMLISETDYRGLLVILLAGAPIAVAVGLLLARRVSALETRAAMERAEAAQAQAREASRRETISWLSHDLRTPLTGIRLLAEDLQGPPAPTERRVRGAAERITREVDRLDGMVGDIETLSRLHDTVAPSRTQVALDDLVSDAVASLAPLAERERVDVVDGGLAGSTVSVDPQQVSRALSNILRNALQHTNAGHAVVVTTRGRVVTVADGCGGIPEADLPHLATPGWRGDAARAGGGMGLGLAIADEVARSHGGSLAVRNADDPRGCVVTFELG